MLLLINCVLKLYHSFNYVCQIVTKSIFLQRYPELTSLCQALQSFTKLNKTLPGSIRNQRWREGGTPSRRPTGCPSSGHGGTRRGAPSD